MQNNNDNQGISGEPPAAPPADSPAAPPAWPWAALPAYRADYRLRNPLPDPAAVIAELAERKQWLIWRYEPGEDENKKYRKIPFYVDGGKRYGGQGGEKDRARLATLAEAVAAAKRRDMDGLGFAFLPDDGLIGVDLDGMIDPDSGEVSDRCAAIIQACASYTELSPSGKGVHVFCTLDHASGWKTFKSNAVGVECFIGAQFFTFTARPWPGAPLSVNPMPEETLRRLKATVEAAKGRGKPAPAGPAQPRPSAPTVGQYGGKRRSKAETVALAEEALAYLPPDDYQDWIEMGMVCKAELGTAGFVVWDTWSAKSPKYVASEMADRWDSFEPSTITLAALFSRAAAAGWESPWAKAEKRKAARAAKDAEKQARREYRWAGGVEAEEPPAPPLPDSAVADGPPDAASAGAGQGDGAGADGDFLPPPDDPPGLPEPPPENDRWQQFLVRNDRNQPTKCLANAELYLRNLPPWKGCIGYDEFALRTVFRRPLPFAPGGAKTGEWTDYHDVSTAIWLQRTLCVEFAPQTVAQAVENLARNNGFHPVRDALNALPAWDGQRRNERWLSDYLGVEDTPYVRLVSRFFLIGMVKRVFEPGCKFDYALVLEGEQGRGKSTAVRILGWNWYADTDLDLNNKDSLLALPGHWVYEISEMGSLAKAEAAKQKSFLSRMWDEFRPPYGKRMERADRQVVFVGTTNEEEYLKDPTGGRRFWPVLCAGEFDLDGLRENIYQMYAEALVDYRADERCWPTPDEQKSLFSPEQARRGMQEPFDDLLYEWVKSQPAPFSMAQAATDGLQLSADKLTVAVTTRIGHALKKLGCGRKENRLAADPGERRMYVPPSVMRKPLAARSSASAPVSAQGGIDVGF